eukprot:TRINITY_DN16253_c0_g1_i2.p1 TRINITY_DN16253_c0_g1~~TRINITY_DN16253_c0_g1_i2.p1  ORF type:complete len:296 (-),score=30.40 TRINITY_DN16253_c0_g1_i2:549-1436(-)
MCWSLEVTTFFVCLEFSAIAFIVIRNSHNDRLNAFLHTPILFQEFSQFVLWMHMGSDGEHCDVVNKTFSHVVAMNSASVPLFLNAWARRSFDEVSERDHEHSLQTVNAFLASSVGFCLCGIFSVFALMAVGWLPQCTYIGPNGHQEWPFMVLFPGIRGFIMLGGHVVLALGMAWGQKPSFVVWIYLILAPLCAAIEIVRLGTEWGSFWCFEASVFCVLYLFEPCLLRRFPEASTYLLRLTQEENQWKKAMAQVQVVGASVSKADTACAEDQDPEEATALKDVTEEDEAWLVTGDS